MNRYMPKKIHNKIVDDNSKYVLRLICEFDFKEDPYAIVICRMKNRYQVHAGFDYFLVTLNDDMKGGVIHYCSKDEVEKLADENDKVVDELIEGHGRLISDPKSVLTKDGDVVISDPGHWYSIKGNEFVDVCETNFKMYRVEFK